MPRHLRQTVRTSFLGLGLVLLAACGGGGLSGTYEATDDDGGMSLEFKGGGVVTMTIRDGDGAAESTEGTYVQDGNNVTIQAEGGVPLVLVRDGDVLQANLMGQALRFEKK